MIRNRALLCTLVLLFLTPLLGAREGELILQTDRDWCYYVELMDLTLLIPLEEESHVSKAELEVLEGDVHLFDQYKENSYSFSVVTNSGSQEYREIFRIIPLVEKAVILQAGVELDDGSRTVSSPVEFRILPHPETKLDSFIYCHSLTDEWVAGQPGSILVEIFSIDSLHSEPVLPESTKTILVKGMEPLESRTVYLNRVYHRVESYPLRVTFTEPGEYTLLPEFMTLDFINKEDKSSYQVLLPVLPSEITVQPAVSEAIFSVLPDLEIDYEMTPEPWKKGDQVELHLTLTSSGDLSVLGTPASFSDFPAFLEEEVSSPQYGWVNDRVLESRQYRYTGVVPGITGVNLKNIEIPYNRGEGSKEKALLELGRIEGNYHPAALFAFFLVMLLTVTALILFVIITVRRSKNSSDDLEKKTELQDIYLFSDEFQLTNRERDVLKILVEGKSTKEIATELYISPDTAKKHINNIMGKTATHSRLEIYVLLDKYIKEDA